MALYLIAIGGSGARCVESVVHLASAGLMSEEKIKILFVDPDQSNGNYIRTCKQIDIYNECRAKVWKAGDPCQWMRTEIINLGISTVGAGNNSLANFFGYNAMVDNDPVATGLFDVLYTKEERDINLSEGFRGRPAIGSAFMSQLNFQALRDSRYQGNYPDYLKPWAKILEEIDNAIESSKVKILLCGSVFGGTGAAGLPVIARLLNDFYKGKSSDNSETQRDKLTLGSLLILPYFGFAVGGANVPQDAVYARSPEFALNTAAAMQYYRSQMQDICDVFYCLGDQNRVDVGFSVGGESQENKAHIVEFYAGLAVRDFLYLNDKPKNSEKIVFAERRFEDQIGWADLPSEPATLNYTPVDYFDEDDEPVVRHAFRAAVRFAFIWYNTIVEDLDKYCSNDQSKGWTRANQVWLGTFFDMTGRNGNLPPVTNPLVETSDAATITKWCKAFSIWLAELHDADKKEEINLFFIDRVTTDDAVANPNEYFGRLVQDDPRSNDAQRDDTVDKIKLKLDPREPEGIDTEQIDARGYVGLAKYLYVVCSL